MNLDEQGQLWTTFLSGEGAPSTEAELSRQLEAELSRQLEADPAFRSDVLQDAELDSLLRESGRRRQGEEERFVASVIGRLETTRLRLPPTQFPVVPPPRVIPWTDDRQSNEPVHDSGSDDVVSEQVFVPVVDPIPRQHVQTVAPESNLRIWLTLVAPLAAVTLIAITVAMTLETGRVANQPDFPNSTSPSLSKDPVVEETPNETSTPETASRDAVLAEHDRSIPTADHPSTDQNEGGSPGNAEVAIGNNKIQDRSGLDDADPGRSEPTAVTSEFAALTDSTSDVRWYHPPRPGQQGESLILQSGTVDFRFASGTTVKIEAPAEFEIDSDNSLLLARGNVSVHVPQQAIGFTIDTPTVRIVDLGTRFDTQVSSSGAVGLQVREGKVSVRSTNDVDQSREGWVVGEGEYKFVEPDGTLLDWKVEVTANVFGEIEISLNGQSIPVESADDIEAIVDDSALDVLRPVRDPESFAGRYVFNGQVQKYDSENHPGAADTMAEELAALATIARRAEDQDGAYRLKNKQYPYSGLRDQVEARRKIARIYGPRALGGEFWPREKIETVSGDCSGLDALQRKLISRLDFVVLGSSNRGRSQNRDTTFEVGSPAVARQDTDSDSLDSDEDDDGLNRPRGDQREDMLRKLEGMRQRKASVPQLDQAAPSDTLPVQQKTEADDGEESVPSGDAAPGEQTESSDPPPVEASSDNSKRRSMTPEKLSADQLVASALEAETLGKQETRTELLGKVLHDHPNHLAANWQSGRIVLGRDWLDVNEAQQRAKSSPVLAAYERMRATSDDGSADGNLKLARWCRARRPQASQMYYTRLLDDPQVTNPVIRSEATQNLDLVSFQGEYLPRSEVVRREDFARRYKSASHRWQAAVDRWAKSLRPQSRDQHKQRAIDEMKKVDDPDIALIVSRYAGHGSEAFGVNVAQTLERFLTPETSQCLARYGARTMWPKVHQAAVSALRDRNLHDYVPGLLGSLAGKTTSQGKVERFIDGTIRLEHVFRQESATTDRELRTTRNAEARVNYAPVVMEDGRGPLRRLPDRDPRTGEGQRIERMFTAELARKNASAGAANAMAQRSNEQIYRLLSGATGQQIPDETIAWWNWWQVYNGIDYEKANQTYFDQNRTVYTALDFGPRYQRRHSCFAAGTPVATETGMRPIEEIVAGDRVFAKHPDSGELKLQTVLLTTVRPPSPVIELRTGDETIRATPGHPFWVTSKGWRMAKLLQEGDQLHGMSGVVNLEQTRPLADPEPVYNLVVAEFNDYFVGSSMVLVHDNTFRRPTPARIPGL